MQSALPLPLKWGSSCGHRTQPARPLRPDSKSPSHLDSAPKTEVLKPQRPQLLRTPGSRWREHPSPAGVMDQVPVSCQCPLLPSVAGFPKLCCELDQPGRSSLSPPSTSQLQVTLEMGDEEPPLFSPLSSPQDELKPSQLRPPQPGGVRAPLGLWAHGEVPAGGGTSGPLQRGVQVSTGLKSPLLAGGPESHLYVGPNVPTSHPAFWGYALGSRATSLLETPHAFLGVPVLAVLGRVDP